MPPAVSASPRGCLRAQRGRVGLPSILSGATALLERCVHPDGSCRPGWYARQVLHQAHGLRKLQTNDFHADLAPKRERILVLPKPSNRSFSDGFSQGATRMRLEQPARDLWSISPIRGAEGRRCMG